MTRNGDSINCSIVGQGAIELYWNSAVCINIYIYCMFYELPNKPTTTTTTTILGNWFKNPALKSRNRSAVAQTVKLCLKEGLMYKLMVLRKSYCLFTYNHNHLDMYTSQSYITLTCFLARSRTHSLSHSVTYSLI